MGYSFRFLKPHHPYFPTWVEYRRRRQRYFWWVVTDLASIGAFALAFWWVDYVQRHGDAPEWMFVVARPAILFAIAAAVTFVVAWFGSIIAWLHFLNLPCPHCGRPFSKTWYWRSFVTRCLHCGLEQYAPCDPAEQEWEFESQITPKNDERAPS